jgi:hypothetical protein
MANYGQDIVDRGLERLQGTWEYNGTEYDLVVEEISWPDQQLLQKYMTTIMPVIQAMESDADPEDVDIDAQEINEQVRNLGTFSWEDDDVDPADRDLYRSVVEAKLIKPEVDVSQLGTKKTQALGRGMMEAWQEADDVAEARDEMPLEGNA